MNQQRPTEWAGWQSHPAWAGSPQVDTVYFGGGTPSFLSNAQLERVVVAARGVVRRLRAAWPRLAAALR